MARTSPNRAVLCATVISALFLLGAAKAPRGKPDAGPAAASAPSVAPLGPGQNIGWAHAPFQSENCAICHERKDPKNPGKITMPVNELCYSCHEEIQDLMQRRPHSHEPARKDCTLCHNPHNAPERKLLVQELTALCFRCHPQTQRDVLGAKVSHMPVTDGDKCMNCHNPHAASVERLLRRMPYDLCVTCHGIDDVRDSRGVKLANIKQVLEEGPVKHGPVASKDCSACHAPHGSPNFRLLFDAYPAEFYAAYDPENYALCFGCHKSELVRDEQTTTLTKFRNGSRNLHFVHVNKAERGRTCRACHETHASRQPHMIRDTVPYGPRGWPLDINFRPLPDGGECARTCHASRTYSTRVVR
ncbi:MAG: hypothetical protein H6Q89_3876 [Myxococcaceae bacterium]|nr:hypothetical protein [Myxococcaceae bacterium]